MNAEILKKKISTPLGILILFVVAGVLELTILWYGKRVAEDVAEMDKQKQDSVQPSSEVFPGENIGKFSVI